MNSSKFYDVTIETYSDSEIITNILKIVNE